MSGTTLHLRIVGPSDSFVSYKDVQRYPELLETLPKTNGYLLIASGSHVLVPKCPICGYGHLCAIRAKHWRRASKLEDLHEGRFTAICPVSARRDYLSPRYHVARIDEIPSTIAADVLWCWKWHAKERIRLRRNDEPGESTWVRTAPLDYYSHWLVEPSIVEAYRAQQKRLGKAVLQ